MSAKITFSELFTYSADDTNVHLPISRLGSGAGHVHGRLDINLSGRPLPHLGYFGPTDVCFNTWVEELRNVTEKLDESDSTLYVFDEGEQAQPAFEFKRDGDLLYVSVVDSPLSGASGDPSYQLVSCLWAEFLTEVNSFFLALRDELLGAAPGPGKRWWLQHARQSA